LEVKVCSVGLSPAKVVLDSNSHLLDTPSASQVSNRLSHVFHHLLTSSRLAVTSQHYKPSKGNVGSFETRGVNSEFDSRVSVRPSNSLVSISFFLP
jgi:hypothetical protein